MINSEQTTQDYNTEVQKLENNNNQSKAIEIPITKTIFSLLNIDNN